MRDSRGCASPRLIAGRNLRRNQDGLAHLLWASIQSMVVLMT